GNGGGLTNVNVSSLNGLNATNFWQTTGNSGTTAGVNFVGTTDGNALELHVDGTRALRLEPFITGISFGAPYINVIGGASVNYVASGIGGATIGGGGNTGYATISSGFVPATSN